MLGIEYHHHNEMDEYTIEDKTLLKTLHEEIRMQQGETKMKDTKKNERANI